MNIVVVGAHPDDPESGCGGFTMQAVGAGHRVVFLYLTSGYLDRRYGDRPVVEVRELEARAACELLGTEPNFLRMQDGAVEFNAGTLATVTQALSQLAPDFVLTHWPVDFHPDHQVAGVLVTQAVRENPRIAFGYYPVCLGQQTRAFETNRWIDISAVAEQKKRAVECHQSQNVRQWWPYHDAMDRYRGCQVRTAQAEGFYVVRPSTEIEGMFFTA